MDSVTQIALGSAVGHAVLGRQIGRRAILWGAVLGTLPDLDVLLPAAHDAAAFTEHRGFSHSLLVMALATPVLVWLIRRIHPDTAHLRGRWYALVYLVLATHALLDAFTVYGTQLFWPLSHYPISGSAIFIIDPLYTLPLLVGVGVALFARDVDRGMRANTVGLVLSCLYLAWACGAKWHTERVVHHYLAQEGIPHERVLTTPGAFNTLIWRIVVMDGDTYLEGFYSLIDGHPAPTFTRHTHSPDLLAELKNLPHVARLRQFTHGYYRVQEQDGLLIFSDLRMGMREVYVFRFALATRDDNPGAWRPITPYRLETRYRTGQLGWLRQRLRDATAD